VTADEVLEEFLLDPCCIDCPASDCINERRMAEEIVRLREERDALQADILARSGFRTLWEIDHACVNNERDVALRILAALREPSEAVLKAAFVAVVDFNGDLRDGITAAVEAAEREASV